jgi:hypothetical protein
MIVHGFLDRYKPIQGLLLVFFRHVIQAYTDGQLINIASGELLRFGCIENILQRERTDHMPDRQSRQCLMVPDSL